MMHVEKCWGLLKYAIYPYFRALKNAMEAKTGRWITLKRHVTMAKEKLIPTFSLKKTINQILFHHFLSSSSFLISC